MRPARRIPLSAAGELSLGCAEGACRTSLVLVLLCTVFVGLSRLGLTSVRVADVVHEVEREEAALMAAAASMSASARAPRGGGSTLLAAPSSLRSAAQDASARPLRVSGEKLAKYVCTPAEVSAQNARWRARNSNWWSHSACPVTEWQEAIGRLIVDGTIDASVPRGDPVVIMDIGCNKGYLSAEYFGMFLPNMHVTARTLENAIKAAANTLGMKLDGSCGACGDCNNPAPPVVGTAATKTTVHCIEPSPATFAILLEARNIIFKGANERFSAWPMHPIGMSSKHGALSWHKACNHPGDELCTIVPDGTPGAIVVNVTTVDLFRKKYNHELIHILKIDAEGLDPLVLEGAKETLRADRAVVVEFEFNPNLALPRKDGSAGWGLWAPPGTQDKRLRTLHEVSKWMDDLGYDCYLESRSKNPKSGGQAAVTDAPALFRLTGGCMGGNDPPIRGWSNAVCASRAHKAAAELFLTLATDLEHHAR